jgi:hypothetical protein
MKILLSHPKSLRGNTLLLTIVVTGLIGFLLASYMGLVRSQNVATMRSQSWNATIPVIEAGLEEALTHINIQLTNDLTTNGWTKYGTLWATKRWVGSNYYSVTISNWLVGSWTNHPVVEARGYVTAPVIMASMGGPVFATVIANPATQNRVARGIRCLTTTDALFSKGLVAKGQIDLNGKNILSDSYDSRSTNYSTNGRYDETKRKAGGSVATNSGLTNSVNIGNATIYGKISTGPGGSIAIGPQGAVGDATFVETPANNGKIQKDYFSDDMNVDFGEVRLPNLGTTFTPSAGVVGGTNYAYVLGAESYRMVSFTMNTGTMMVTGQANFWIQSTLNIGGSAKIVVTPGARLTLYVGMPTGSGATASIAGGGIVNQNSSALSFQYYGLPSNTALDLTGNGMFVGSIYAPNADLHLSGAGGGDQDFSGAAIAKTVTMGGNFKFHYDEALQTIGPPRGYVVTRWDEMTPQDVAAGPSF